jgi:MEMO1 family protein
MDTSLAVPLLILPVGPAAAVQLLRRSAGRTSLGGGCAGRPGPLPPDGMKQQNRIRPPAVAGQFYPGDAAVLRATVQALLAGPGGGAGQPPAGAGGQGGEPAAAGAGAARRLPPPKAIIAPHAGYAYSGPIAGSAFRALAPGTAGGGGVRRVVVIGPAHRVAIRGLALPDAEGFATPLGEVPLDAEACERLAGLPQVAVRSDAHREEHALEVELPFLQVLFGDFRLVPLVVGQASGEQVAEALELVWGDDQTVVVVSSDLSHFLPAASAERVDRQTAARIAALTGPLAPDQACGAIPINGLLLVARRRALAARQLDLRHSGDTSGDRSRVVGYGAWAFEPQIHHAG